MINWYILDENQEVVSVTMEEYSEWEQENSRQLNQTFVSGPNGNRYLVSTVFLGLDHGFGGDLPVVFETMVFDNGDMGNECYQDRCTNYELAIAMHDAVVKDVEEGNIK